MRTLNHKGEEVNAWIERRDPGEFPSTSLIKPTEADIVKFKLRGCNHEDREADQLVWDDPAYAYDIRYCVICGRDLGMI